MYSKSRNTLTALIAVSLFLASGWMFGHPVDATGGIRSAGSFQSPVEADAAHINLGQSVLHGHRAMRMSLAMPYYSFSLTTSERRAD